MRNFIVLICSVFFLIGCVKKTNQSDGFEQRIGLMGEVVLNEEINSFINNFMKSLSNPNCIYELYIDKKTENEYLLTLFNFPNDPNYLSINFPVNYTIIERRYVFIYSGLEDFVKKQNYKPIVEIKDVQNNNFESVTISKVILKDTSYIVESLGIPFSQIDILPTIKFIPPIEE